MEKRNGKFKTIKTIQPREGFGVFRFEEIEPGKLILNLEGRGGTYIADYDISGNFKFTRLEHPKLDSIKNLITNSSDLELTLRIQFLIGIKQIWVILLSQIHCQFIS